ncbi:MFS transporter [uncultured Sunxiuqinia sp.]|uniref:MFS transporter n=1 Tax=uncultured Sunxiuqinia sp. TaxID=1573825 RepID=UPI002AA71C36|nr:MFS transporter [uncultured Sunxiuqinia sp.]
MQQNNAAFKNNNIYIIFSVTLIAMMGVASITPAFPDIIAHFKINPQQVGGLIVAFTLPGIFLTPVTGTLADRYGRKLILVPSLFLFGIAGISCMFAPSFFWLLVLRFIQGIGASSLSSLNITLVGDLFSGETRTKVMGYNASVLSIGTATYPAVGGAIAVFGWQFIFILPILAIPLGIWIIKGLNNPEPKNKTKLKDYFSRVWKTINQKNVWVILMLSIILFIILYGTYLTYFPLMMKTRFGSESYTIGLMMSLMSVTTAIVSSRLSWISKKITIKQQLIVGSLSYFFSTLLMMIAQNYGMLIVSVMIFGVGHGVIIPSVQNLLVGYASIQERGAFMSVNSMVLRMGQTLGPLIVGIFYSLKGLNAAFGAGSGLALLMFLIIQFVFSASSHK